MFFSSGKNNSGNNQAEPYMNGPKSRAVTGPIHTNPEQPQQPYTPPYPPQGYGPQYGPQYDPHFSRFNPNMGNPNMPQYGAYPPPFPPYPSQHHPHQPQPDGLFTEQRIEKKGAQQKENLKTLSFWQDDNDYYDQASETPKSSPLKFIAAIMGLVVLTIIVWLGYRFATQPQNDQIPLIQAEQGPYKRRPENPGGANFPHQEMLVYGRLDTQTNQQAVEHVLPQQEYPYTEQQEAIGYEQSESYYPPQPDQIQQQAQQTSHQQQPEQAIVQPQAQQQTHAQQQVAPVQTIQQNMQQGIISPDKQATDKITQATSSIEKALETVESETKAVDTKPAEEPKDPKALTPGHYMQLGKPLPSEKSAQNHWAWIKKKFPADLSDVKPIIRPTDAGVKKKFSVLVGPFSSRNAALKKCVRLSNGCSVKHIG